MYEIFKYFISSVESVGLKEVSISQLHLSNTNSVNRYWYARCEADGPSEGDGCLKKIILLCEKRIMDI